VRREWTADLDSELIARAREGDCAAFGVLVQRYNQRLFRIARSILRTRADAEDAMQQAYVQAYAHLHQFEGRSNFATWLTRILIREALSLSARRMNSSPDETEGRPEAVDESDPEAWTARREYSKLLQAAVDALPEHYRIIFVMREIEGMTTAEAAGCLDISEEAAKVRLHRAKGLLRERLSGDIDARAGEAFVFMGDDCRAMVQRVLETLPAASV
jgi:RNA polymerase sigma-70 factor, ECF subfamily